jgi:CheY-like chemotaxis protein
MKWEAKIAAGKDGDMTICRWLYHHLCRSLPCFMATCHEREVGMDNALTSMGLAWHANCGKFRESAMNFCIGENQNKAVKQRTGPGMKRILIVDDEQLLLQGMNKALQTDVAEVVTVETGEAALKKIVSSPCHLCFLDVFLPDMDGTDVLKKIRSLSPKTKVVMMTAGIITNAMKERIEKNAYMFITKPFDLLQIKMLAQRIIEEPEA